MELEQLRQLVEIERSGTISAAAEKLHITQPALSRSIRRLEQDLGHDLFDRGHNSVTLNEAGRLALQHAKHILADERLMRNDFEELSQRMRTLNVVSVAPAPTWHLSALVVERFPDTILSSHLMGEKEVDTALLNREADLAILRHPLALPTVRCAPIMSEDLYASIPKEHPLAKKRSVSFADLDGEPFLVFAGIGSWMDIVEEYLPSSQIVVQEDREVFVQFLRTSSLLAFSSDAPENASLSDERVKVPITDAAAHATYFLACAADAHEHVLDILKWVSEHHD
ncbi:MAG: LysR family transcriptional regulator [Eggerthellaceae bacterium]|jgi:LysR family cyn operon transcriptional activator